MSEGNERGNPFAFLTRRRVLRLAGGGAAAVALASGSLLTLRGCAPRIDGLKQLSNQGYRTMASIARTQLPVGGAFAYGADDADLARGFDLYLVDEHPEVIRDLSMALHLVEFGPLIYDHALVTFSNLDAEAQQVHWQSWLYTEDDTRRQIAVALKKFLMLVFFDLPEVWESIGYPGPSLFGVPK